MKRLISILLIWVFILGTIFSFVDQYFLSDPYYLEAVEMHTELIVFVFSVMIMLLAFYSKLGRGLCILSVVLVFVRFIWLLDDIKGFLLAVDDVTFSNMFPLLCMLTTLTITIMIVLFTPKRYV